jgi:undecaprenyl phosphate-alpha-L-ara4N flippase subunit ArnE
LVTLTALLCVALIAAGAAVQVVAAPVAGRHGWSLATARGFLSPAMLLALTLYALATVLWVLVLRAVPLSIAFPLYALVFLLVPLAAQVFLGEPLTLNTLIGGAIIVVGVFVAAR